MNIAKLNTASLDDKTFIIKKGTSGGGTTINNQNKVVDITENGTVDIVPDAGYTGLSKVTINTEVSGGGGNSSINELYIKDIPEMMTDLLIAPYSYLAKCRRTSGEHIIITSALYFASYVIDPDNIPTPIAYMLLGNTEVMTENGWQTISDIIATLGLELTYITKEEFYSLE